MYDAVVLMFLNNVVQQVGQSSDQKFVWTERI